MNESSTRDPGHVRVTPEGVKLLSFDGPRETVTGYATLDAAIGTTVGELRNEEEDV